MRLDARVVVRAVARALLLSPGRARRNSARARRISAHATTRPNPNDTRPATSTIHGRVPETSQRHTARETPDRYRVRLAAATPARGHRSLCRFYVKKLMGVVVLSGGLGGWRSRQTRRAGWRLRQRDRFARPLP
jgi:hypothetical protein